MFTFCFCIFLQIYVIPQKNIECKEKFISIENFVVIRNGMLYGLILFFLTVSSFSISRIPWSFPRKDLSIIVHNDNKNNSRVRSPHSDIMMWGGTEYYEQIAFMFSWWRVYEFMFVVFKHVFYFTHLRLKANYAKNELFSPLIFTASKHCKYFL